MKVLDKIALALFSSIILIVSVVMCLLIFGWVELSAVNTFMRFLLNDSLSSNITLGISILLVLLAIKCIFFDSSSKQETSIEKGVLLQNENGKLLISKETIQNLVNGVVKKCGSAQDVNAKVVLSKDNKVEIEVTLFVLPNAVIKELSNDLQLQIKEKIKQSLDLDVKEINIKIKNIAEEQETVQE